LEERGIILCFTLLSFESKAKELLNFLLNDWRIVLLWLSKSSEIEGIALVVNEEIFKHFLLDEFPFLKNVELVSVKLQKLIGRKITRVIGNEKIMRKLMSEEIKKISKTKSVMAILSKLDIEHGTLSNNSITL